MDFKGRNIIITGAGRGIGQQIAFKLADKGANLILISRTKSELLNTIDIIKEISPLSFYITADISDIFQVRTIFNTISEKTTSIDSLINNAGVQAPIGDFLGNDIELWKKNVEINLFGIINMMKFALKYMVKNKFGKVINLSGGGSTSPRPNFSAYGVSKTAIVRLTETLAEEVRGFNVDINAIAPGAINTRMLEEVLEAGANAGSEYEDALKREKVGGNDINKVLDLVCFLLSEKSNGITGKLISAPWDPWDKEEYQNLLRKDKDIATLRRIDNKTFYKKT